MKESTGGALLMGFAAIILLIFIIMSAFFISYSKLFRLKDKIINSIEQNEGLSDSKIDELISENYKGTLETEKCYKIIKYKETGSPEVTRGFIQKITVYMKFDRAILGDIFNIRIPITGETRIIEKGNIYTSLSNNNITAFKAALGNMDECAN